MFHHVFFLSVIASFFTFWYSSACQMCQFGTAGFMSCSKKKCFKQNRSAYFKKTLLMRLECVNIFNSLSTLQSVHLMNMQSYVLVFLFHLFTTICRMSLMHTKCFLLIKMLQQAPAQVHSCTQVYSVKEILVLLV